MSVFGSIFIAMLAALGVALAVLEFVRRAKAKKTEFICLCFREELLQGGKPDMLIICRTDAEEEEIIRRIGEDENRRIYLKYL